MDKLQKLFLNPVIIGHRGFRALYPENTMASFKAAIAAGADMIELDVHLTKDHRLAVIHDEKVDRTTNGRGRIGDLSLKDLEKLDAGKWFNPKFSDERIPVLDEVLDLVRDRLWINIEIKADPEEIKIPIDTGDRVIKLVKEKNAKNFAIVSSFNWELLKYLHNCVPDLMIGVLTYKKKQGLMDVCHKLNAVAWHPHFRYFDRDELKEAKNAGLKILPYTVNTEEDMKRLLDMGVDGFFTDDPMLGKKVIKQVMGNG